MQETAVMSEVHGACALGSKTTPTPPPTDHDSDHIYPIDDSDITDVLIIIVQDLCSTDPTHEISVIPDLADHAVPTRQHEPCAMLYII